MNNGITEELDQTGRTIYQLQALDGERALVGYTLALRWWVDRGELTEADIGDRVIVVGSVAQTIWLKADRTVEGNVVMRGDVLFPDDGSPPFAVNGYRVTVMGNLRV